MMPISGKPEIGCREPGIQNDGRKVDSGFAAKSGAPE
jgi:hypothetical protein